MNFTTVEKILSTIRAGDPVDRIRQDNRLKVTNAANCVPPLTDQEAKQVGLKINIQWGGMMRLLAHARRQYLSAFWSNQHFFKVKMPFAPKENQSEWEEFITETINKPMRESVSYFEHHRSRWASVTAQGIGPLVWYDEDDWEPCFVAPCDFRVATDTTLDFKNLGWYAIRHIYTPYELLSKAFDNRRNNEWNKKAVADILKNYKEVNYVEASQNYDWETSPEKLAELVKQDGGYYSGDAMPGIPLWHFYFEDDTDDKNKGWFLRIVPESGVVRGADTKDFLWTSTEPVASKRDRLMQCQWGDLSIDPPFKVWSVRSLGFALLEPEFYSNLTLCRLLQHIHDNFNIWLRITDPVDKARAQVQEFSNLGVVRTGVTIIPKEERHQIDGNLVEMALAQLKQLEQEASSTYTQQIDTGTQKEQTAFETSVRMQQVNAMLGGLLLTAFKYASAEYREECRRFCKTDSTNDDVKTFLKRCKQMGIPRNHLNVDLWDIEPVTPLGMGNPTMAQAAAQQLMAMRPAYEPSAQQEILHDATLVITGDPRKAARWAPLGTKPDVTGGEEYVSGVFGTLMQGIPVRPPERILPVEQLDAILPMFGSKIQQVQKRDNVGSYEEITGLHEVFNYAMNLIKLLAADPQQKARVVGYSKQLTALYDNVKGFQQRLLTKVQAQGKENGNGGTQANDMAKARTTMMMAGVKAKATADKAKLTEKLKAEHHVREQRRRDADTYAQIGRDNELAKSKNRLLSAQE